MSAPHGTGAVEQIEEKEQTPQPQKKNRFRFFASAVKSLQKWMDALSPKYVYGQKKAEARQQRLEDGPPIVPTRYMVGKTTSGPAAASTATTSLSKDASRARASSARSGSRTQSDRPSSAAGANASGHHGRKGRLLFKPLPPMPPKSHA